MHDTLGLARCSRGVEKERKIFGIELFGGAIGGCIGDHVMVPKIATFGHANICACAFDDNEMLYRRIFYAGICVLLQVDGLATAIVSVSSDDDFRITVDHAITERVRAEY